MVDPDEILARARAATATAVGLEDLLYDAQVRAMLAHTQHLLVSHSPAVEAHLRRRRDDDTGAHSGD